MHVRGRVVAGVVLLLASSASAGIPVECFVDADCDDGLFCTGTQSCVDNQCVGLSACPPFVDGCLTVTGCDEVNDTCIIGPDDSLCDDGVFCNGIERCNGDTGACEAVSSCPPFVDGCIVHEGCDEETDTCLSRPDDSLCDDNQFCNGVETCDGETGSCAAVSSCPPVLDGCLTNAGCDEETDTCLVGPDDSLCDDGEFCNGVERCNGETGGCEAVSSCPPFVDGCITNAGCDEETDTCLVGPDDSLCAEGETCQPSGECVTTTTTTSTSSTTSSTVAATTTTTSTTLAGSTTSTSTTSTTIATSTTIEPSTTTTSTPTTTSSTTTTLAGTTTLLPGAKLLVKRRKSGAQRLLLIVRDDAVMAADPCGTDGALVIEPAGGLAVQFDLLADLWRPIKAKKPEQGCKYRKGPVVAFAQLKVGKMLKVIANGDDLGVPLATDPSPVRVELRHGAFRHCMEFGGDVKHKPDKKLLAKKADPATGCPSPTSPGGAFLD